MFYHNEINTVMYQWRNKYIDKDEVLKLLGEIEGRAYERIPNAEPDDDITYAVATAIEEVLRV